MAKINETLRQLRLDCGMTQEQTAKQLGVTRQAVSGYEAGRTQPNLDILQRLADIYQVELTDLIYGNKPNQRLHAALKVLAIVTVSLFLIMVLAQSLILWTMNHFLAPAPGMDSSLLNVRFDFLDVRDWTVGICGTLFRACSVAVLVLTLCLKRPIKAQNKLLFFLSLILGTAVIAFPLALTDPVYMVADYILTPTITLLEILPLLAASFILDAIRNRRKRKQ